MGVEKIRFIDETHLTMKYQQNRTAMQRGVFGEKTGSGQSGGRYSYS